MTLPTEVDVFDIQIDRIDDRFIGFLRTQYGVIVCAQGDSEDEVAQGLLDGLDKVQS